jgi:hypothetical protein
MEALLKDIVERVLAPLVGLRVWGPRRDADLLTLQLGDPHQTAGGEVGTYMLQVACAWRIAGPTAILVASGDLFTPADQDADLETFDWDVPGASWWDVRMTEVASMLEAMSVVVTTFLADSYGGVRLVCTQGIEIELFPNSSPAPHVESEFWRLSRPAESEQFLAVGSGGVELVESSDAST